MSKEQFDAALSVGFYPNTALLNIFVNYCEKLNGKDYTIAELEKIVNSVPTIEHILAQSPDFAPESLGFKDMEDFCSYEHRLGNLTLIEKALNSSIQKKVPLIKVELGYDRSMFPMTKKLGSEIVHNSKLSKVELDKRTKELREYCIKRWWSKVPTESSIDAISFDNE